MLMNMLRITMSEWINSMIFKIHKIFKVPTFRVWQGKDSDAE